MSEPSKVLHEASNIGKLRLFPQLGKKKIHCSSSWLQSFRHVSKITSHQVIRLLFHRCKRQKLLSFKTPDLWEISWLDLQPHKRSDDRGSPAECSLFTWFNSLIWKLANIYCDWCYRRTRFLRMTHTHTLTGNTIYINTWYQHGAKVNCQQFCIQQGLSWNVYLLNQSNGSTEGCLSLCNYFPFRVM